MFAKGNNSINSVAKASISKFSFVGGLVNSPVMLLYLNQKKMAEFYTRLHLNIWGPVGLVSSVSLDLRVKGSILGVCVGSFILGKDKCPRFPHSTQV